MRDFNENTATAAVLERMSAAKDARFKEIMTSVVTHLHQPEMNLRGLFTTGPDGRFFFRTVKPSSYPIPTDGPVGKMLIAMGRHPMRPAHVHFIVGAPGLRAGDYARFRRRRCLSRFRRRVRGERQPDRAVRAERRSG
jgi:hypothetical protein